MTRDLAHAFRTLRRSPGFTLVALVVVAVSIGGATTVAGAVYATLRRPMRGVASTDRLVWLTLSSPRAARPQGLSWPDLLDYREAGAAVLDVVAAYEPIPVSLGVGEPIRINGHVVIGEYFGVFGVRPALGRFFMPEELHPEAGVPVLVLGHDLWRERFNSDARLVGGTLQVNGRPFVVIGVASPAFVGPELGAAADLWLPAGALRIAAPARAAALARRDRQSLAVVARLAAGVRPDVARQHLSATAARLGAEFPDSHRDQAIQVTPMQGGVPPGARGDAIPVAALLIGLTGIILLIAGVNLAGLHLSRALERRRDAAIRRAMGASRGQLFRQALSESIVLAVAGGGFGVLLAAWIGQVVRIGGDQFRGWPAVPLLFTLALGVGLSLLTVVASGISAAGLTLRGDGPEALTHARPAATPSRTSLRLQRRLVVAQLTASLVLLFAAAQFARAVGLANTIELGFDPDGVSMVSFDLVLQNYDAGRRAAFADALLTRLRAVPGVAAASLASVAPLSGTMVVDRVAPSDAPEAAGVDAGVNAVSPGFFATLGLPLRAGRPFTDADHEAAPRVAIVNEIAAERLWPGRNAVGQHLRLGDGTEAIAIVGVARSAKYDDPAESPMPFVYLPIAQHPVLDSTTVLARSGADAALSSRLLAGLVHELDPALPVFGAATLRDLTRARLDRQTAIGQVLAVVGLAGMAIALVGLHGLLAFTVTRRTREIGIRMALGLSPRQVLALIVSDGVKLAAVAVTVGAGAAAPVAALLSNVVFGLRVSDVSGFAIAALLLVAVTMMTSLVTGSRAAQIRPIDALRAE